MHEDGRLVGNNGGKSVRLRTARPAQKAVANKGKETQWKSNDGKRIER